MAKFNKANDNSSWRGCRVRGLLMGVKICLATMEITEVGLRKLAIDLSQDPDIPFFGMYPKDSICYYRDTFSSIFVADLFRIVRNWKHPRF